ncbi:MAG: GAF domain-containing protein, partial [Acidobacteria bacterium]|nr:GAF domain-containing protein [Acidobacteriota bacterium]MDW7985250.1 GAF domain-containing protein [Acidobacteriota bacterium]
SIQVWASVPLTLPTGEWLGTLTLASRRYEALQEEDARVLWDISRPVALAIWHARLRRSAEERLRRLTVLRQIDQAIIQRLDLREVLTVILENIPTEMGADAVAVSLLDETRYQFQVFLMRLPDGRIVEEEVFSVAESLLHWFVKRQTPVIIYDITQDPRLQMHREVIWDGQLFSYLGVPLVVRGETIGVLHMFTTAPRVFSDEDVMFFRTLAGQAAIALVNAQVVQETRRRAAQMETLHQIVRAANERLDRRSIVQAAIEELDRALPGTALAIFSYDGIPEVLVLEGYNAAARPVAVALGMDIGTSVEADRFGWSDILKQGQVLRIDDLAEYRADPYFERLVREVGLRSVLLVPIVSEGNLLGILHAGRLAPRAFTAADAVFLTALADHLAVVLRNARLFADLERAYRDLQQAQAALVQQERLLALGQMASGIAHDINNALVPIVGYAELLEHHGDDQVRDRARRLSEAAADIARIVERLRVFYQPRLPEEALEMVDLNEAVRRVVELTRPRWYDMPQREGVTIEVETDLAEDLPGVAALGAEVREALMNLVFNAVDAVLAKGEPRGRIVLRTRQQGEWAIIEVTDTGVGMDEETRRRAVEPFFTTKGERGSGLGLAMVYGTMRRHEGGLELESVPGRGTTARLVFPIRAVKPRVEVEGPEAPTGPMRILLIDDDPRVRQVLGTMLQEMGHRVTVAEGGAVGLSLFEEALQQGDPYDIVVTDLGMPGVPGTEVVRRVKTVRPSTPVIVLTGWGQEAQSRDVDAALRKPVTWRELKAVLDRFVPRRAQAPSRD